LDAFTSSGNYLGTDRLKRRLTDAERDQLQKVLRKHDFVGASMVALRFAYKLTRNRLRAGDLMGRTNLRLLRWGWDPNDVALVKRLCRLVWSEHTHQKRETAVRRRAEEHFLDEEKARADAPLVAATHGDPLRPRKHEPVDPTFEQEAADEERSAAELGEMRADLAKLRACFVSKKDDVNVLYLDQWMAGVEDVAKMVENTGREPEEFYAAQKRRKRAVERLLAEKNGAPPDDEENE
jgi:hypothetical protein